MTFRTTLRTRLIVLCALAPLACARTSDDAVVATSTAAPAAGSELVAVISRPLGSVEHLQGELTPFRVVDLFARVAGYVKEVRVDRGSVVRSGDVLIVMEAPELTQQRTEAEAKLAASRQTATRLQAASKTAGAVAPAELDAIQATVNAEAARVAALHDLESYLTVRAPFDGVVSARGVHPGALVGPSSGDAGMLLRLEDHARLRLTVSVPERLAGGSLTGRAPTFTVAAWPGESFHGTVARISGSVDPKTRGMPVEIDVTAGAELKAGMFADVAWPAARSGPSLLVPTTAIVQTSTRSYVVRANGGVAELVDIKRGMADGDLTEVYGKITWADTVVKRGSDEIAAGARLRK